LVNNVASFWLPRGYPGAVMVRDCDHLATAAFRSANRDIFRRRTAPLLHIETPAAGGFKPRRNVIGGGAARL